MKRLTIAIAAAVSALGLSTAHAVPGMKFSDNSELFVTGTASVAYDDNIFVSSGKKTGDTLYDLIPGLDLPFGSVSDVSGDAFAKVDFVQYADHSGQDAALPDLGLTTKYDEGKSKFDFNAGYQELAQNNASIRLGDVIVKTDEASAGLYGESGLTEKSSIGAGINYLDTTYNQHAFIDSSVVSVPVDAYYSYSPKTDVSVGYKYTDSEQNKNAPNYDTNFVNVGLRGEFTPLLTGQIRVGYEVLQYSEQPAPHASRYSDQLGVDGNFTYAATDKSSYTLDLSNGYDNSGIGVVTKDLTAGISGKTELNPQWQFVPGVTFTRETYPTVGATERRDNIWTGSAGIVYIYNTYANVALTYSLNDDNSSTSAISYSDSRVTLAVNLRY
jgi:hypothetical protein